MLCTKLRYLYLTVGVVHWEIINTDKGSRIDEVQLRWEMAASHFSMRGLWDSNIFRNECFTGDPGTTGLSWLCYLQGGERPSKSSIWELWAFSMPLLFKLCYCSVCFLKNFRDECSLLYLMNLTVHQKLSLLLLVKQSGFLNLQIEELLI